MKSIAAELAYFLRGKARQNLKVLAVYCGFLMVMTLVYATLFRHLMLVLEGREFSFIAGIYWTLTVMTTLGFGDITFHTDLGYAFAALVTISGVVFLLIILPFGIISLFVAPWIEQRLRYRPMISLPAETRNHVLIFGINPTTRALIHKLQSRKTPFVVVTDDYHQSLDLEREGKIRVACGAATDRKLLSALRIEAARYVLATLGDTENTNLCLTVRSMCKTPIAAVVDDAEHIELLRLAGADQAIPVQKIIGRNLGIRATTCGALAHVIGAFGALKIAEIPVYGSPFAGKTLGEAKIRQQTGLTVVGVWRRGLFEVPSRDTLLHPDSLAVLAGTKEQLGRLEELTGEQAQDELVYILGHGRIGCAAAAFLDRKPVPYMLVDQEENPACEAHIPIIGDATNRMLLQKAGIEQAKGVIVTTNDDSTNVFLTLSSRHSNPHLRIVSRANSEENVEQLYAAGADFVVSNASVGANILINVLETKESVFLTEGISVFRRNLPSSLAGKSIADSRIRPSSGCSIVAIEQEGVEALPAPPPETVLVPGMRLIMIGSPAQEVRFGELFSDR